MQKEFLGYLVSARRNSNFPEMGLPKLTFRICRYFPVILSFPNFFIFRNQSQVLTTTGQKYDRYMTTSKKIRPLALKYAKLEHFKVKRHKFDACLHLQPKSRILHHLNKNGSYSANFEGRPIILFSNETLLSIFQDGIVV